MIENAERKHIHVIGICGVATSAIAIAFHKKGWKVTGSDKGFFPPVSTELEKSGIPFYAGWHPEKMSAEGNPDIIMIGGGGTSPSNPEAVYAREHNIPIMSYAEILNKYFIKKNSIVVCGTWGKTTTSAMLSYILLRAGMDPSYFTGGLSLSHDTGAMSDSDWSVVEGDEYQVSISDRRPKFVYYSPTHLLLTSVSWDHADLYPTEENYFETFEKLASSVPNKGMIVACFDNEGVRKVLSQKISAPIVTYGSGDKSDYRYSDVKPSRNGISFVVNHKGQTYQVSSPMLGKFNAENMTAAFALAHEIGIDPKSIIEAIGSFKGIKRRFEKRFDGDVTVLDCHAPTPEKAMSVLQSLREVYDKKIVAVYEPNIGGRQRQSASKYDNAFSAADIVIIPHLTKLKIDESQAESERPIEGIKLKEIISPSNSFA